MLQGGRNPEHHETELEVLETSIAVDEKHMEERLALPFHGTVYLDGSPLRGLHYGNFDINSQVFFSAQPNLQVDKLFNPFTLLVGPVLVAYVVFKSTKPVDEGGYHLPWWYVSRLWIILSLVYALFFQERHSLLHRLVDRNTDSQAAPTFMAPTKPHNLRAGIHSFRILLRDHEGIRFTHVA